MDNNGQDQSELILRTVSRIFFIIALMVMLILGLRIINLVLESTLGERLGLVEERSPDRVTDDLVLDRANDAVNSAELLLSVLEGFSVLIALGLGASAIYGVRNSRELRQDMTQQLDEIRNVRDEVAEELESIREIRESARLVERYQEQIANLPTYTQQLKTELNETLASLQENTAALFRANQELSLKNYAQAYKSVSRVLEREKDNIQALYIAGWLELQYVPAPEGGLDKGLEHLRQAKELSRDDPSIVAAYGVAWRRKARSLKRGIVEQERYFTKSLGYLQQALGENPNLIDLNFESLWGPVAGTQRDLGDWEAAIGSYEKALKITPQSSYPAGNLANLYLKRAKEGKGNAEDALEMFETTVKNAGAELGHIPKDYFPTMDLAMAYTMRGKRDARYFEEGETWLNRALELDYTCGMLRVSCEGWYSLRENCPPEWTVVREKLDDIIRRIDALMEKCQDKDQDASTLQQQNTK